MLSPWHLITTNVRNVWIEPIQLTDNFIEEVNDLHKRGCSEGGLNDPNDIRTNLVYDDILAFIEKLGKYLSGGQFEMTLKQEFDELVNKWFREMRQCQIHILLLGFREEKGIFYDIFANTLQSVLDTISMEYFGLIYQVNININDYISCKIIIMMFQIIYLAGVHRPPNFTLLDKGEAEIMSKLNVKAFIATYPSNVEFVAIATTQWNDAFGENLSEVGATTWKKLCDVMKIFNPKIIHMNNDIVSCNSSEYTTNDNTGEEFL